MSYHSANPLVIGLTGYAGAGKDTVASLLQTHCGAYVTAFADPLRGEICDAFCLEQAFLMRRETKEHPMSALALARCMDGAFVDRVQVAHMRAGLPLDMAAPRSPRQIMQWWGTEYRRANDVGYWTSRTRNHIRWLMSGLHARLVVVSDVRYANEAELIRQFGGQLWRVKRPGCEPAGQQHSSAVDGSEFSPDAVINNAHDVRHLQGLVLSEFASPAWGVPGVRVEVPQQPIPAIEQSSA